MRIHEFVWTQDGIDQIAQHGVTPEEVEEVCFSRALIQRAKTPIPAMEKAMSKQQLPQTDSIQELARFWDAHDLTDFEDELDEVTEPVFERDSPITLRLQSNEAEAIREMAKSKGVKDAKCRL